MTAPVGTGTVDDAPARPDRIRPPRPATGSPTSTRSAAALRSLGDVVVAFSGGADSAFVAEVATDTLGADRVLCVTAVSPSLAPEERDDCRALAAEWGLRHLEVATDELADPAYAANDGSRCYHCKASLMAALGPGHRRRRTGGHGGPRGQPRRPRRPPTRARPPPPSAVRCSPW